jgi:hypothetical protein
MQSNCMLMYYLILRTLIKLHLRTRRDVLVQVKDSFSFIKDAIYVS